MKIRHYASIGTNTGDHVSIIGLERLIRNCVGRCEFDLHHVREKVDCESADMILFGGGGLLSPKKSHFRKQCGQWCNINVDGSLIDKPYVVFGVGINTWRGFPYSDPIPRHGVGNLRNLIDNSALFRVRNDGSKQVLASIGIECEERAPSAFFAECNPDAQRENKIAFQVANNRAGLRFNGTTEKNVVSALVCAAQYAQKKYGSKVVFVSHSAKDDDICSSMANDTMAGLHLFDKSIGSAIDTLNIYKSCRLVVGMRGHSIIMPVCIGTPTVGVATYDKIHGFMKNVALSDYCVDVRREHFKHILIESMCRAIDREDEIRKRMDDIVSKMKYVALDEMKNAIGNIRSHT